MKHPKFTYIAKIGENGKTIMDKEVAARVTSDMTNHFNGCDVHITIQKAEPKISDKQLGYYRGCIVPLVRDGFRDKFGRLYTLDDVHEWLKREFNSEAVINEDTGEVVMMPKSTMDNSKAETEEYHEMIRGWAYEFLDLTIPLPDKHRQINF